MRSILRVVLASVLLIGPAAAPVFGATIQDLIKLKAAGLSDDILIALIETDGSVFNLKADDVIAIRKEGLSEKVIMAMLATAIKKAPATPAARPASTAVAATTLGAAPQPQAPPAPAVVTPSIQINEQQAEGAYDAPPAPAPAAPQIAPVVINITQRVEQRTEASRTDPYATAGMYPYSPYYPYLGPVFVAPVTPVKAPAPVFWGFGGQRRPGSWKDK